MNQPTNPLSDREQRIVEANSQIDECPECSRTVHVADVTDDGQLYVSHVEDGVGIGSRSDRGETDGCRVDPGNDPTL